MKVKKGKFSKRLLIFSILVLTLGAAVYINWKNTATDGTLSLASAFFGESTTENKEYLGEAEFVNSSGEDNYFETARSTRDEQRTTSLKEFKEILSDVKSSDEAKLIATQSIALITTNAEKETAIESLIKAKGFQDCLAIISEDSISCVVKCSSEGLNENQTAQIQDIILSNSKISCENIKIIEIK